MTHENKESKEHVLFDWQKAVKDAIDTHVSESKRDSEQYQGVADYHINKELGVTVVMPRRAGHTYLANYIAAKYSDCMLVYTNRKHFDEVTQPKALNSGTETVSMYEIFYALYAPSSHSPSPELADLTKKIKAKKVIVVDNSLSVPEPIKEYLYAQAEGIVIMLGH